MKTITLGEYAARWIAQRDLKPRTRTLYEGLLARHLAPLTGLPITGLTTQVVRNWYASMDPGKPTVRSHAYAPSST